MAVPRGQAEAGTASGMSRFMVFRRIIWPQMVRFVLPGFTKQLAGPDQGNRAGLDHRPAGPGQ